MTQLLQTIPFCIPYIWGVGSGGVIGMGFDGWDLFSNDFWWWWECYMWNLTQQTGIFQALENSNIVRAQFSKTFTTDNHFCERQFHIFQLLISPSSRLEPKKLKKKMTHWEIFGVLWAGANLPEMGPKRGQISAVGQIWNFERLYSRVDYNHAKFELARTIQWVVRAGSLDHL